MLIEQRSFVVRTVMALRRLSGKLADIEAAALCSRMNRSGLISSSVEWAARLRTAVSGYQHQGVLFACWVKEMNPITHGGYKIIALTPTHKTKVAVSEKKLVDEFMEDLVKAYGDVDGVCVMTHTAPKKAPIGIVMLNHLVRVSLDKHSPNDLIFEFKNSSGYELKPRKLRVENDRQYVHDCVSMRFECEQLADTSLHNVEYLSSGGVAMDTVTLSDAKLGMVHAVWLVPERFGSAPRCYSFIGDYDKPDSVAVISSDDPRSYGNLPRELAKMSEFVSFKLDNRDFFINKYSVTAVAPIPGLKILSITFMDRYRLLLADTHNATYTDFAASIRLLAGYVPPGPFPRHLDDSVLVTNPNSKRARSEEAPSSRVGATT